MEHKNIFEIPKIYYFNSIQFVCQHNLLNITPISHNKDIKSIFFTFNVQF